MNTAATALTPLSPGPLLDGLNYQPRVINGEGRVRLHNGDKPKNDNKGGGKGGGRKRNPPTFNPTLVNIAVPIGVAGFLATWVVQGREMLQARMGWDRRAMAIAQIVMVIAGAWGTIWALKQPWGRQNKVPVLVGATALLSPIAVDGVAGLLPERAGSGSGSGDGTNSGGYSGMWTSSTPRKPMIDQKPDNDYAGLTSDVDYAGLTGDVTFSNMRPRQQHN